MARAGAVVVDFELPEAFNALMDVQPLVMNAESVRSMGWEWTQARAQISEGLQERLGWGLAQGGAALAAAQAQMRVLQDGFAAVLDGCDILLTPSAPGEAPAGLEWTGDPVFNSIWTALHVPCVTVPAGAGPNGLPLGMQIVGARGADASTLAWAQWVAAALG